MEQVFELVNTVLRRDRDTLKRELRIRCYKVIPLASQAGVLEFVTNTTPLIVWLRKAHAKYVRMNIFISSGNIRCLQISTQRHIR